MRWVAHARPACRLRRNAETTFHWNFVVDNSDLKIKSAVPSPTRQHARRMRYPNAIRWRESVILRHRVPVHNVPPRFEIIGAAERCRSEEHTSELQSHSDLVCRLLLEKKKTLYYSLLYFLMIPRPPTSTLFPYTTLFRSDLKIKSAVPSPTRQHARRMRYPNAIRWRESVILRHRVPVHNVPPRFEIIGAAERC